MTPSVRILVVVAALAAATALPATAQAAAAAPKLPEGVTPALIEQGKKVFGGPGLCFACHGMDAKGSVGPNLTDKEWIHVKDGDYAGIIELVTKGVPQDKAKLGKGPMPPKGGSQISDADVKAVAAYVWSLSHGS